MRLKTAALALLITTPVAAESVQFPITIPQECFELAQREGVPTVIENRIQATKAKLKLARVHNKIATKRQGFSRRSCQRALDGSSARTCSMKRRRPPGRFLSLWRQLAVAISYPPVGSRLYTPGRR